MIAAGFLLDDACMKSGSDAMAMAIGAWVNAASSSFCPIEGYAFP